MGIAPDFSPYLASWLPVCYVILVVESRVESAMKKRWLELPRDENQQALFDSDAELFMYSAGLVWTGPYRPSARWRHFTASTATTTTTTTTTTITTTTTTTTTTNRIRPYGPDG